MMRVHRKGNPRKDLQRRHNFANITSRRNVYCTLAVVPIFENLNHFYE